MHKTLVEFLGFYSFVKGVTLFIGKHHIVIDLDKEGSWLIIRNFENEKFFFKTIINDNLILSIND